MRLLNLCVIILLVLAASYVYEITFESTLRAERVAKITAVAGQPQIVRDDLKRMIPVTGRISGRDLGSAIREAATALPGPGREPRHGRRPAREVRWSVDVGGLG